MFVSLRMQAWALVVKPPPPKTEVENVQITTTSGIIALSYTIHYFVFL